MIWSAIWGSQQGGSGSGTGYSYVVDTYADLPASTGSLDFAYVRNSTYLSFPPKLAGTYLDELSGWTRGAKYQAYFDDTKAIWYDDGDPSKKFKFQLDGLSASSERVMTVPDQDFEPDDKTGQRTPTAHKTSHETGGSDELTPAGIGAEPEFSKNSAFNKDFGSSSGEVTEGDDPRLSDDRDPNDHASNHTDGTDDIQNATASQKGLATATQITKLDGVEAGAEVNQTDTEIKTQYENNANTNAFTDADATKLDGIEPGAEVNLPFGKEYNYSASEGQSDTNSTTPVNKLTMTTPTLPAGDYKIEFSYEWKRATISQDFEAEVLLDGTAIMEQNEESKDTNSWHPLSGFIVTALTNATHTIVINFWGENGGNTSSIRRARLNIYRVS